MSSACIFVCHSVHLYINMKKLPKLLKDSLTFGLQCLDLDFLIPLWCSDSWESKNSVIRIHCTSFPSHGHGLYPVLHISEHGVQHPEGTLPGGWKSTYMSTRGQLPHHLLLDVVPTQPRLHQPQTQGRGTYMSTRGQLPHHVFLDVVPAKPRLYKP